MFLRVNKNFLPVKFWKSISWQKVSFWISAQSIMAVLTLFFVLIRVTTGKDSMKFHKWAPARRLFTHFFSKIGIYPLDILKYFDYNDFKILWPRNGHADSLRVKIKKITEGKFRATLSPHEYFIRINQNNKHIF